MVWCGCCGDEGREDDWLVVKQKEESGITARGGLAIYAHGMGRERLGALSFVCGFGRREGRRTKKKKRRKKEMWMREASHKGRPPARGEGQITTQDQTYSGQKHDNETLK